MAKCPNCSQEYAGKYCFRSYDCADSTNTTRPETIVMSNNDIARNWSIEDY